MRVSEIYDDLKSPEVLGTCSERVLFSRLTSAVSLVANQGIVDPLIGQMDLCVCDGCVTLPAEVETVLGVNQGGMPTLMRDEWFQYHINGSGSLGFSAWGYTDVLGRVSTYKDPSAPVKLAAIVESSKDSSKALRVFGWDEAGKRIYTDDGNGNLEDGIPVPTVYGFTAPHPTASLISRIDRVYKEPTNGFVKLVALADDGSPHTTIGHYQPWETDPSYTRIKVKEKEWLRIKYRKRNLDVKSANDWINIDNREVILLAVKAVNFRMKNDVPSAQAMESEAIRILNHEANAKRPPTISPPQMVFNNGPETEHDSRLFY